MNDKIIHKKFKSKNFSVYLTEYQSIYTVEYTDKRKVDNPLTICNHDDYMNKTKAEFHFNRLVESCIVLDIVHIKEYILYMQNDYKQKPIL